MKVALMTKKEGLACNRTATRRVYGENYRMKAQFVLGLLVILTGCESAKVDSTTSGSSFSAYDRAAGSSGSAPATEPAKPANGPAPKAGVITAGEWNDLVNWSFWQGLMQREEWSKWGEVWPLWPSEQYTCQVTSSNGQPAADVSLTVRDGRQRVVWEGATDPTGRARITPQLFDSRAAGPFEISATVGQQTTRLGSLLNPAQPTVLRLPSVVPTPEPVVDVQLVVDATGSMGDEMNYLKTELNDVVLRAQRQLPSTTFRMGSVFYRDQGDEYLTRPFAFSNDLNSLVGFISQQQAGGGGDFPEAVDAALETGLKQQWSTSARTRILFLVLDAPPHNTPETIEHLADLVKRAGQKGIRIIPITASGIDKSTEFLMRTMAIGTQGTYVFITDHSGIGNKHLEPTIGDYKVEYLNELMTRLLVTYANP